MTSGDVSTAALRRGDGTFRNARQQDLYYCTVFPAEHEPLRGIVCYLHGIGEYAERFTHLFDRLARKGYGVLAYDMVGHGKSHNDHKQVRAHAKKFRHFVDDTNAFLTFAKKSVLPQLVGNVDALPPLIFMGISYGCLVGAHTILSEEHQFHGIVFAAPAMFVNMTPAMRVQAVFAKPLSLLLPTARVVPAVDVGSLSRNPEFTKSYQDDELVIKDDLTARMGEQSLKAMLKLRKDRRLASNKSAFSSASLLIVQGSHDKVTHAPSANAFHDRVGNSDKEYKEFVGLYHCLFNEPEQDEVMQHVLDWLDARYAVA